MPLENSAKKGSVDCEKYWPQDWTSRNTKQQILLSRESVYYLYRLNSAFQIW